MSDDDDKERVTARERYLEAARRRYSVALLPIRDARVELALEPIYQPLRLREAALTAANERQSDPAATNEPDDASGDGDERDKERIAAHAEDALARSHAGRIVILGAPGAGKTTTLHRLGAVMAQRALDDAAAPLPFYLTLASLARSPQPEAEPALADALADAARQLITEERAAEAPTDDPATLAAVERLAREAIARRHAVFLLDGLDEVEPARRARLIAWLNQWAAQSGGLWIIGSRYTEYKGGQFAEARYDEWELLPLDRPARLELARRLLPALSRLAPPTDQRLSPTGLLDALEMRPQTRAWAENPLLLSLAAVVYASRGALPSRRAGLYDAVIDATFAAREPDPALRLALRQRIAQAALALFQRGGRTFTREEALAALTRADEPRAVAEAALWQTARAGLIEAPDAGPCYFRHLTLQEYLAGEALADDLTAARERGEFGAGWDFAWGKRLYSRWREALRLMAGALALPMRNADPDVPFAGMRMAMRWTGKLFSQRNSEEGDPGALCFGLALSSISELPDTLESGESLMELQTRTVREWRNAIRRYLAGYRDALTNRAYEATADIGALPPELINRVVDELLAEMREQFAQGGDGGSRLDVIINLGSPYALEHVRSLLWDPEVRIIAHALWALKRAGALTPELIARLMDDPTRKAILTKQLSMLGAPLDLLLRYKDDADPQVRVAVMSALGRRQDAPSAPLLAGLDDEAPAVRAAAANSLATLRRRLPLEILLAKYDVPEQAPKIALILITQRSLGADLPDTLLWDIVSRFGMSSAVVYQALTVLATTGDQASRERLIALALNAETERDSVNLRVIAIGALGKFPEAPRAALTAIVYDEESSVYTRNIALRTLAEARPSEAAPILIERLNNAPDQAMREEAARALMQLGADEAVEAALDRAWRENTDVYRVALQLFELAHDAPLDALQVALEHHDTEVRAAALRVSLARARAHLPLPAEIERAILAALRRHASGERYAAAQLVNALGLRLSVVDWQATLANGDCFIVQQILLAIPPEGARISAEVTTRLLRVAQQLLNMEPVALARFATLAPRATLREALSSDDDMARALATLALRALGEKPPLEWVAPADERRISPQIQRRLIPAFSTERLRELLVCPNAQTRNAARNELLAREDAEGMREAIRFVREGAPGEAATRYDTITKLAAKWRPESVALLLMAMEHPDFENYRSMCVNRLTAYLSPEGAVAALAPELAARAATFARAAYAGEDEYQRLLGGWLLVTLGEPVDPAPLYEMLRRYGTMAYDGDGLDCGDALVLLARISPEPLPLDELAEALRHTHPGVRAEAARMLGERPEAAQPAIIARIASLLTEREEYDTTASAYTALRRLAPAVVEEVMAEARALLLGGAPGRWYSPAADAALASAVGVYPRYTPGIYARLEAALHSGEWSARGYALDALQMRPRNTPDSIVRRIYALRHDPESPYIRIRADLTLGAILALESGLEDEDEDELAGG